ncbi:MAG TPA: hypothetical protein VI790_02070 [Candidatus Nanoarchaeia archaeon]|nr:hypothetical protein [Candidatus Nanoarchaeia archaeon]
MEQFDADAAKYINQLLAVSKGKPLDEIRSDYNNYASFQIFKGVNKLLEDVIAGKQKISEIRDIFYRPIIQFVYDKLKE